MNETERMKELVKKLNEAAKAYYQEDREIMSNLEYDTLYDELQVLEEKTGVTLAGSPTTKVGYEAMDELPKEAHESPMLSLDKTKDVEVLRSFIGDHKTLLSWKMDGLTVVLTYRGGTLAKAVTRGNGVIGEVVTNNAKVFENIPLKIPYQGELVLRGEAIIRYSDFEKINEEIEDVDAKYKNPRNLCSGSVRQLNNEITAKRHVHFMAFALVSAPEQDFENSRIRQMEWLKEQGFKVVFSPAGIVMAHILVNLPYAIRLIRTAFEASDQRMEFIARTLGASPWKCFLTILLPLCRRSLVSTFILTWSRALGEFGATLMVVGITRFKTETLPGSIYLSISTGDNQAAMATAMLMLMISGLALFLSRLLTSPADRNKRQVFIR